ncbi:hypothetical protein ACTFIV_002231 [Dictyostelium citrinum]
MGINRIIISNESLNEFSNDLNIEDFNNDEETFFKRLNSKRSEKCCTLSSHRVLRCILEKKQYKLLERYFDLLHSLRSCIVNQPSSTSTKCNCKDYQLSGFYESIFYEELDEFCEKLFNLGNTYSNDITTSLAKQIKQFNNRFCSTRLDQIF